MPFRSISIRHRLPAALAFLPIAVMAWLLIYKVPVGRRPSWHSRRVVALDGNQVVRSERLNWVKRRVAIDLQSGKSSILPRKPWDDYESYLKHVNSRGERIWLRKARRNPIDYEVHVEDADGNLKIDQPLTLLGRPILVGGEYLVASSYAKVEIRDLRNIDAVSFTSMTPTTDTTIEPIEGYARFVRRVTKLARDTVELYEIVDSKAQLLSSWEVEANTGISCYRGKIYSWKRTPLRTNTLTPLVSLAASAPGIVEVRNASGSVLESIQLPNSIGPARNRVSLRGDTAQFLDTASGRIRYFDLQFQREVPLPAGCVTCLHKPIQGDRYRYFLGTYDLATDHFKQPYRWVTYDRTSGKIVSDIDIGSPFCDFRNASTGNFLLVSAASGYSIIEVSEDGSEIVRTHAPYAWAGWMMPLTALLFAAWSTYWVRCSIQDGGWTWIDCLLIGGLPLVSIWQRMHAVESHLLMLIHEVGLYVGVLSLATAWLVFGRTRASLRFLVVAVLVSLGLHFGLAVPRDEQVEAPVIFFTLATAAGMCAFGSILRFAGLTCLNETQPPADTPRPRITIAGYFGATIGIALLTVEARSVTQIRMTGDMAELGILAIVGGTCGLLMLIAALLALCRKPSIHYCTGALCGLVAAAAVALPWSIFVYGARFSPPAAATNWGLVPAALTIPFATTFILFLPYRIRGWRIAWRPGN